MQDNDLGFRAMERAAHHAVAYRREIEAMVQTPTAGFHALRAAFSLPTPEAPTDANVVIDDLVQRATPGLRASTAPRFFGWVIGSSHPVGVAADWLASAWGQNACNIDAAPAASAIEAVVTGWLLDLLDLPRTSSVGFVTGATVASFTCLAAARGEVLRRVGWDVEADGLFGAPPIQILVGDDAHATIFSALKYLGLGANRVTCIETDRLGRMRPSAFERAVRGAHSPVIAIAQAGQLNTGASDPFSEIAPLARDAGAWLHVDGAFGLWGRVSPTYRGTMEGVELADSWSTDGHKWLQTPYDCGFAIVRDPEAHRRAMAISASYLPAADGDARNPSDYVPELSRRARGFATWAMIRHLGRSGITSMVDRACHLASYIAERLAELAGVEIICPVTLNQVMVRFVGATDPESDALTLAVIDQVKADAIAFVGGAIWRGQWIMRISVSSILTTTEDADLTIAAITDAQAKCLRPAET